MSAREPHPLAGYFYAGLTILIWASFVVISRLGGKSALTPFDITALRLTVSGLILGVWLLARRRPVALKLHQIALFVACVGFAYPLLTYSGFTLAPASHGALLLSGTLPFTTALLGLLILGERLTRARVIGLLLIAAGVGLIGGESLTAERGEKDWLGDTLFLCASLSWAVFTVYLRKWQVRALDVTLIVGVCSMIAYMPLYLLFLPKNIGQAPLADILLQGVFQGVFVVCIAMILFIKANEHLGPVRVAMLMSIVPALGALLAVPVVGEPLTQAALVGIALVTTGALLGALRKLPPPATAATP